MQIDFRAWADDYTIGGTTVFEGDRLSDFLDAVDEVTVAAPPFARSTTAGSTTCRPWLSEKTSSVSSLRQVREGGRIVAM